MVRGSFKQLKCILEVIETFEEKEKFRQKITFWTVFQRGGISLVFCSTTVDQMLTT